MVTFQSIQEYCRALPHTTEDVKWGSNLVFCVGNKMYAVLDLEQPEANSVSFKCSPQNYERFIQLLQEPDDSNGSRSESTKVFVNLGDKDGCTTRK